MGPQAVTGAAPAVFVTGAGGYLGRHVVRAVLDMLPGTTLRCLVPPHAVLPEPVADPARVKTVPGDLTAGAAALAPLLSGCDAVLHLAGYGLGAGEADWERAFAVNASGTFHLALASRAAGAGRFIMARTALEYGPAGAEAAGGRPLREADPCRPEGLYAATKYAGAELARAVCADAGIVFLGLRVFNTFGPGEHPHKLVPAAILASLQGRSLPMTNGKAVRDYVFVGDVARAFALALARADLAGQRTVNIGSGKGIAAAKMARRVCALIEGAPGPAVGALPDRPGEPEALVADISTARELLGWEAAADMDAALRETIAWYRATYRLEGNPAR